MAAAAGIGIIFLVIMGLVVVGLITGIVLWVTSGRSNAQGEMACGGCGYLVRGLEQLNCPECGADLRAVGISSGGSNGKRLTGILLTVICGLLVFSCAGLTAIGFLSAGNSVRSTPIQQHNPQPLQAQPQPATGQQGTTEGDGEGTGGEGESTPQALE